MSITKYLKVLMLVFGLLLVLGCVNIAYYAGYALFSLPVDLMRYQLLYSLFLPHFFWV